MFLQDVDEIILQLVSIVLTVGPHVLCVEKNQYFNAFSWLPGCLTLVVPPHSADSAAEDFLRLTQSFTLTFTF